MSNAIIETVDKNVWGITLVNPTMNEDTVRQLPEVTKWIAENFKGHPQFESSTSKYWYIVDKEFGEGDPNDYLKETYLKNFIGKELLPDEKYSLETKGFFDNVIDLQLNDKIHFEKHIEDDDEVELISKDDKNRIKVLITNIEISSAQLNGLYKIKYKLVRA